MGWLWAAYQAGSFALPKELSQEDFVKEIEKCFSQYSQVWIVDDRNSNFKSGKGPIGLVLTMIIGLIIEPRFNFFKWASSRNKLRSTAAFLNMVKHSTKTGICLVRTDNENRNLPDHLKPYDLLYYLGRSGDNEYLYSMRGRAS